MRTAACQLNMTKPNLSALIFALPASCLVWLVMVFGPAWTEPYQVANIGLWDYFWMTTAERVGFVNASNLADQTVTGFAKLGYLVAANPLPYCVYWLFAFLAVWLAFLMGAWRAHRASGLVVD